MQKIGFFSLEMSWVLLILKLFVYSIFIPPIILFVKTNRQRICWFVCWFIAGLYLF